jgi:hypothetical protein
MRQKVRDEPSPSPSLRPSNSTISPVRYTPVAMPSPITPDAAFTRGFAGFKTSSDLWGSDLAAVPAEPGVYIVICPNPAAPAFLESSPAGRFKGRDPSVPVARLATRWVHSTDVIYIGKAGGARGKPTLRTRLRQYLRHGRGDAVGHWGGRLIWQLAGSEGLLFCWRPTPGCLPRDVEREMLRAFEARFGRLPFANLRR